MTTDYFVAAESGFGSKLLDLIINEQLQGSYARTCTEGGMDIEIILPGKLFSDIPSNPSSCHRRSSRTAYDCRNLVSARLAKARYSKGRAVGTRELCTAVQFLRRCLILVRLLAWRRRDA